MGDSIIHLFFEVLKRPLEMDDADKPPFCGMDAFILFGRQVEFLAALPDALAIGQNTRIIYHSRDRQGRNTDLFCHVFGAS